MKKLIALSAMLALTLVSCDKEDDKPVTQPEVTVAGKWKLVSSEYIVNGETTTEDLKPGTCDYDYYDLKAGGVKDEVYHDEDSDCATENWPGTWTYNDSNKYMTLVDSDDNYTIVFQVVSLTASDLKVKLISDNGTTLPTGTEVYAYLKR